MIIAVDEKSLAEFHQWPWPRSIHARLIDALKNNPPKALLFDIFFIDRFHVGPGRRPRARARDRRRSLGRAQFIFERSGERRALSGQTFVER